MVASFLLIAFLSVSGGVHAQDEGEEKKEKPLPPALIKDLQKMKDGKADRKEILKIAENLLKNNDDKRATELYSEYAKEGDEQEVVFNRATALLKANKIDEAMPLIQQIYKSSSSEAIKDKMRRNLLLTLNSEKNGQNKNKDDKKDDKKDEKKDDKKEGEQEKKDKDGKQDDKKQDKKDGKDKEGKEKDSKDSKSGQDQKQDKKDNKDGKDKEEKDKKDPKDLDKPDRPDPAPKTLQEKEKMIEQKRKMVKTPAMVKQILNDDRELQKKMMDTSTNERGAPKPKRDW
jgi:Ca-activated chloride channel family protein